MYQYRYPHPAITADCVVIAHTLTGDQLLLVERKHAPCQGMWAFPGGFMNIDETAEAAASRELREETGVEVGSLEQIGAFSAVDRDPRERVVTIAYLAELPATVAPTAADDAAQARWFPLEELPPLAFDHAEILEKALEKLREIAEVNGR